MPRADRYAQLIEESWSLVRAEGTDALTLGRLAERAGVTKPVVYSHFASRAALLAALFTEFDERQSALLEQFLAVGDDSLHGRAEAIADSYVECALAQGRELTGVLAALEGSPELERVKRASEQAYVERCREILAPFSPADGIPPASLTAILGAADALSQAAASGALPSDHAKHELTRLIVTMTDRN